MKLPASFALPRAAIGLVLAVLAAGVLIGINETGYNQSSESLQRIEENTRKAS